MADVETFSTAGVLPRHRVEYWNELSREIFLPCSTEALDPLGFSGSIRRTRIANLLLAEVSTDELTSSRSARDVAQARGHTFFLQLQLEGTTVNYQAGREGTLRPGDLSLGDSARPSTKKYFGVRNQRLMLGIPAEVLRRHVHCPEDLAGVVIPGSTGTGGLTGDFLVSLWRRMTHDFPEVAGFRIAPVLLDLVAAAYAGVAPSEGIASPRTVAHRTRIVSYIEAHLHEPDLTLARVAAACRMTPRHLHHVFGNGAETASQYILRRRLQGAAAELANAAQRHRTVTAIAFDHGFANLTHFGKVFRERYGMTPMDYRRQQTPAA